MADLRKKLAGAEKKYCPDGFFNSPDTSCYLDELTCNNEEHIKCTSRDIPKTNPTKDGRVFLRRDATIVRPNGRWSSIEACSLYVLIARSTAGGAGMKCTKSGQDVTIK